jgi:hypothetical protein
MKAKLNEITIKLPKILKDYFVKKAIDDEEFIREYMQFLVQQLLDTYSYSKFEYEVAIPNRCEGLKMEPEDKKFRGYIDWSEYYNNFYLTLDGITYTDIKHAFNIKPINWVEEKLDKMLQEYKEVNSKVSFKRIIK